MSETEKIRRKPVRKNTEFIQIYLTEAQKSALAAHCEAQGVPISVYVRQMLAKAGAFELPPKN